MNTDRLFKLLSQKHFLPMDFQEALKHVLSAVAYPKGHHLVQAQTVAHHA